LIIFIVLIESYVTASSVPCFEALNVASAACANAFPGISTANDCPLQPLRRAIYRDVRKYLNGDGKCEGSSLTMCIQSASREAQHLHAQGRVREAAKLLQSSIVLLTTMARRIAGREGQLTLLSLFPGLAGDAALVVLDDSHALSQALQLLELGRSIINATTMDYRTQLMESDHEEYPDIVRRFNQLRMEVDVGTHSDTLTTAADAAAWARRQADVQIELNSLLEEVRC
jgi:hypothetical protein